MLIIFSDDPVSAKIQKFIVETRLELSVEKELFGGQLSECQPMVNCVVRNDILRYCWNLNRAHI